MRHTVTYLIVFFLSFSDCLSQANLNFSSVVDASNARFESIGQSGIGMSGNSTANRINMGSLAFFNGNDISLSSTNWLANIPTGEVSYYSLSTSNHFENLGGTLSLSAVYIDFGVFNLDNELPHVDKKYQLSVYVGYSTKVIESFGVGFNIRYSQVNIDYSGYPIDTRNFISNINFDFGLMWHPTEIQVPAIGNIGDRLSVGLIITNVGEKIDYMTYSTKLPTNIGVGIGFQMLKEDKNTLEYLLDFNRIVIDNYKTTYSTGLEYWYGRPKLFALRIGYTNRLYEYSHQSLTFGAGLCFGIIGCDVSYRKVYNINIPIEDTWFVTLHIRWCNE